MQEMLGVLLPKKLRLIHNILLFNDDIDQSAFPPLIYSPANNMSYVSLIFCLQTLKLVRAAKDIQFLVHYAKNYFQIDCGRRYQEPEKD